MGRSLFSLSLVAALFSATAHATIGDCGLLDAPFPHSLETCQGVCVESGSEVVCELETLCPDASNLGASAVAVNAIGSSHDVSMFGNCLSSGSDTRFCCVFDEGSTNVTRIELNGTNDSDEVLALTFFDTVNNLRHDLKPWDASPIQGVVRGNEEGDVIWGSWYTGSDYEDILYGQHGDDSILGNDGNDFLIGGPQPDGLEGGNGDDTLWGGDGDDQHEGGAGADTLCDSNGYDLCASDGGNKFDGGSGNDKLWYNDSEDPNVTCPDVLLDPNSTAGDGNNDQCGDSNNYLEGELPLSCETYITEAPSKCEAAN